MTPRFRQRIVVVALVALLAVALVAPLLSGR